MDKQSIVEQILGCAGCVIDDNWIIYPTESEEGYNDSECVVVSFYANSDDEDPIMEFSMDDLDNAQLDNGVLFVNDTKVQLLTKLNFN